MNAALRLIERGIRAGQSNLKRHREDEPYPGYCREAANGLAELVAARGVLLQADRLLGSAEACPTGVCGLVAKAARFFDKRKTGWTRREGPGVGREFE